MEMTIDKAKNRLENYYDAFCGYSDDGLCGAIYTAIDTMRKYQKIEEIMHKVYTSDSADVCLVQRLAEIRKVIEDGNDV